MDAQELLGKVRKIEIRARGLSRNVFAGEYHSAFRGRGMAFAEVREYQYGDDVRDIDWNVTARLHRPYVKLFEEERELTVMLLVDVSGSLDFGSTLQTKRDMATEMAATLAFSAIQNNDKYIPPQKGRRHILYIIREMLQLKPQSRRTDIGQAIEFMNRVTKRRATVFVISDFYDTGDYEHSLNIANRKHDMVAIQLYDPLLRNLPNVGLLSVTDAETGHEMVIDTGDERLRRRHHDYWAQQEERLQAMLNRCQIDHVAVATNEDYVQALLRLFKQRG